MALRCLFVCLLQGATHRTPPHYGNEPHQASVNPARDRIGVLDMDERLARLRKYTGKLDRKYGYMRWFRRLSAL